jgi:hypothetical protein
MHYGRIVCKILADRLGPTESVRFGRDRLVRALGVRHAAEAVRPVAVDAPVPDVERRACDCKPLVTRNRDRALDAPPTGGPIAGEKRLRLPQLLEQEREPRARRGRALRVLLEARRNWLRVHDRVAPLVKCNPLREELRAEAVRLAGDRVDAQSLTDQERSRRVRGSTARPPALQRPRR